MLEQVCDFIHNYFVQEEQEGEFEIINNTLSPVSLVVGQRFRIVGSVLNDGMYTYGENGSIMNDDNSEEANLLDETFTGIIYAMSVPRGVLSVVDEINDWVNKYGQVMYSPYSSESFGGYSYSKAQGYAGAGGGMLSSWQSIFGTRLNAWRKIA